MRFSAVLFLLPSFAGTPFGAAQEGPILMEGFEARVFASEPLVRNPCAIAFDTQGRLSVGMGPQYRSPQPDTPGDSVYILHDQDGDGVADARNEFATGFSAIQGLAWRGDDLWIANAPDLTRVRDTDGDGKADEYVRVYTDLGNLEHGLHGLQWGPDRKLYMSKGNSKGHSRREGPLAPRAFRELWGVDLGPGVPDHPEPAAFTDANYEKGYHDPADDWGLSGGFLRCDPDGRGLEIIARGFRNPWDLAFDDAFNWFGTDNDQTHGDKPVAPFFGAHFGWGHPWSNDWKGDDHLPSAPSAGPLFEGSGTGVVYIGLPNWPASVRGSFVYADWLQRELRLYRPSWAGAWMRPEVLPLPRLAHADGGRSMARSTGRAFDPVDLELGPDGALYVSSWGREYGAVMKGGTMQNAGRIYRIAPKSLAPLKPRGASERSVPELIADLGHHLPAWRTDAQEALLKRPTQARPALEAVVRDPATSRALQTWGIWTLGHMNPLDETRDAFFTFDATLSQNQRIQCIRVLAHRLRGRGQRNAPARLRGMLADSDARIRHETVLALHQIGDLACGPELIERGAIESDRVVAYSVWQALRELLHPDARRALLRDSRAAVRRAGLLSLLEDDLLSDAEISQAAEDPDPVNADLAQRRLGGKSVTQIKGPALVQVGQRRKTARRPIRTVEAIEPVVAGRRYEEAVLERGAKAYTDRDYTIRKVPDSLEGATFIRGANSDADPAEGTGLTLTLRHQSTIYLADDTRGERLPAWAREKFKPTEMEIVTSDATHRIYKAVLPAGRTTFGANRADVKARKSNYLLVIEPDLLNPPERPTTVEEVLPLVAAADPEHGRALFATKGVTSCVLCHRLEGRGEVFAPDLNGIGQRADPAFLARSILEPSADITEGFATQIFEMEDGTRQAGIVLGETGRAVRLGVPGKSIELPRKQIVHRESAKISSMPAGYAQMLRPGDAAALVRYLMETKKEEAVTTVPESKPAVPGILPNPHAGKRQGSAKGFALVHRVDAFDVLFDDQRIATYLLDHPVLKRRAFVNVRNLEGTLLTRAFPAGGDDDHRWMHPGLWMSFGWLSKNDYWRLQSEVRFGGFIREPEFTEDRLVLATRDHFLDRDRTRVICVRNTVHTFRRTKAGIHLEWDARFHHPAESFAFGDQEEGGLAIRIAAPLRVEGGSGRIENDRGERNGEGTWGKPFRWIRYSGEVEGQAAGIVLAPHPGNPRPSWSHSRDYGALVANPFPRQPKERRAPYVTTRVPAGETYRLRYSLLLHGSASFDPEAVLSERAELPPEQ